MRPARPSIRASRRRRASLLSASQVRATAVAAPALAGALGISAAFVVFGIAAAAWGVVVLRLSRKPPVQRPVIPLAEALRAVIWQKLFKRKGGKGRVAAYEILFINTAAANLIRENKIHEIDMVIETSLESGMVSLNRSLTDLVRAGEITVENAMVYSLRPDDLKTLLRKK